MSTITCQQTRREISDLLDSGRSALPAPAGEHVESCGDCRQFFHDSRSLDGRLSQPVPTPGGGVDAELPGGFHERVLAAAKGSVEGDKVVPFARWFAPAAGVAAAALVALLVWNNSRPSDIGGDTLANAGAPAVEPVVGGDGEKVPGGLPTGFESPVDVAAMTAVASRGMETAFAREAEAMASDLLKVRDFFTSRVTVVGRVGL